MAVPSQPSVGSRCSYFPYSTPAPTVVNPPNLAPPGFPAAPAVTPAPGAGSFGFNQTAPAIPADCGPAGVALPAIVLSLGGVSPDYQGMQLLVFTASGPVLRYSGFASGQPMLSASSWTTNGSPSSQAHWQLIDALS